MLTFGFRRRPPPEGVQVTASSDCALHGERQWCECWKCGGMGVDGHDCGEDCCVCLEPEDNMRCDICNGEGGWMRCYTCAPETEDEQL